jgi:hypothetical protein
MSAIDVHARIGDAPRLVDSVGDLERRYVADSWRAAELGIPAARGRGGVSFTGIDPRVSDGLCNGDPVDHVKEIDCDRDQGH